MMNRVLRILNASLVVLENYKALAISWSMEFDLIERFNSKDV
jgi:hypothetical protein